MKKYLKLSLLLIPLSSLITLSFNNCARFDANQIAIEDNGSFSSETPTQPETPALEENPYALLSAEQTLASMLKVTNVNTATPAIMTEYNLRYGGLAGGNGLKLANAPLMLGSTSLAGEVCSAMVAQEAAKAVGDRAFFPGINFAAGVAGVNDAGFVSSVRGMARSFWGRNETSAEYLLLAQFKTEFIDALDATAKGQAASTANLMMGVCAAMLSSVDALSY